MMRILLLGGTTEARILAGQIADAGLDAVYSYAGRTEAPAPQPLPQRVGGFGGVPGLQSYLLAEGITHVIDATHPFAAQMSPNAVSACAALGLPLIALERAAWQAVPGDNWHHVRSHAEALAALPAAPARVFLAIGKQGVEDYQSGVQHHFVLRLVDAPEAPPLPNCSVIIGKGPFDVGGDTAVLRAHKITHVIAKNAGGKGASAKLAAARALGLPVIMIARPELPPRPVVARVAEVMAWLDHSAASAAKRGV